MTHTVNPLEFFEQVRTTIATQETPAFFGYILGREGQDVIHSVFPGPSSTVNPQLASNTGGTNEVLTQVIVTTFGVTQNLSIMAQTFQAHYEAIGKLDGIIPVGAVNMTLSEFLSPIAEPQALGVSARVAVQSTFDIQYYPQFNA